MKVLPLTLKLLSPNNEKVSTWTLIYDNDAVFSFSSWSQK